MLAALTLQTLAVVIVGSVAIVALGRWARS